MIQVFVVSGSIGGIAHRLAASAGPRRSLAWPKYPVALVTLTIGAYLGTAAVALAASTFGGPPSRGPISERPWW